MGSVVDVTVGLPHSSADLLAGKASAAVRQVQIGEAVPLQPETVEDTRKSLFDRAIEGDEQAWVRIVGLYQPMIRAWLHRYCNASHETEDLTQDVLAIILREMRRFDHPGHRGAFRSWLRTVTANRGRAYWRSGKIREKAGGGDVFLHMIEQIQDPSSALSGVWDAQHDAHVLARLLATVDAEFEPSTTRIFRKLVFDGRDAADVASELSMTVAAVYGAKSRVLRRLRQEAAGLLD
jgi:RNA polymerase sigma-70 factor (ECF subfamily)